MMDKSEKRFERDIESFLISPKGGYTQFCGQDAEGNWVHTRQHDVSKCIYMDVLCEFIAKTQPKEWAKYTKYYGASAADKLYHRLETTISNQGLLYVLRNGIEDMGCKLKVCFFKPESDLNPLAIERYEANILGCARQFRYSTANTNTIDMVLSINGIPVVALELKNQLTGQDYVCAINQFKHDRSSKEFAFRLNHRFLVYFAVDIYEAWMTTQLADGGTRFLPFNQGSNGAGVTGGAGNPQNPNGYATSYLWEEVLQRDSLLDLIRRFISFVKEKEEVVKNGVTKTVTKEKMIFPRYHQYDVVRKIMADVRENGVGTNYLIQHSAGSGKSNSIAWIAYRLASVHDAENNGLFDSVIVVTNRVVLDSQLQDTINSFEHQVGLVEAIDDKKNSRSLAEAINDKKRIIICTIQKFLFAKKDMEKFRGRKFAIIIDEAHQGQNGESAKSLRRSLIDIGVAIKEYAEEAGIEEEEVDLTDEYINAVIGQGRHDNQSFFAFTATPKGQTLESFGTVVGMTPEGEAIKAPFHAYSMRQAIEEGYILDVLANYTTVKEAFKLIRVSEDNPELIEGQASRALFKYYKQHGYTIAQKTEMIMTNFLENCRYQIGGKGKAMVVADSRANAVRYYLAIKKYLADHADQCVGCDVMVAFSGEVTLNDYPSEKPFTEATVMGFLGCGDERLIIESRFSGDGEDFFFQYLLDRVLDFPSIVDMEADSNHNNRLFNFLLFLFPHYLKAAMRKGLFKKYIRRRYNDGNVKGTIDVARHIEKNTPFAGNIAYSQREFSYDNSLMELVRHTVEFIKRKPYGNKLLIKVKDEVKLVIDATPGYEPYDRQKIIEQNKKNTVRHAYFREYLALQRLCLLILRHQKHQIGTGERQIYGILFDGAWLWEEYINSLIEDVFYHPMNKGGKGAQRLFEGNVGLIYPDFISRNSEKRMIADAKYKPIDNIGNRDYLQVLAYMFRFDAKTGFYLYPEAGDSDDLKLRMNRGSTYEANVIPRDDISITKHGLKIPVDAPNYAVFVTRMELAENDFVSAFLMS